MACCMFAAFIVGHIILMWRRIEERWLPQRAARRAAIPAASAWRPGMQTQAKQVTPLMAGRTQRGSLLRLAARLTGVLLIAVSLAYFAVQAKDAWQRTDDAQSFAVLLAKNICRVAPEASQKPTIRVAVVNEK